MTREQIQHEGGQPLSCAAQEAFRCRPDALSDDERTILSAIVLQKGEAEAAEIFRESPEYLRDYTILKGVNSYAALGRYYLTNETTVPEELYESASLDGASDIRILVSMVVPLSVPILAVMVLFYAVGHWNSYFDAMIYLNSPELYNIQLVLRNAINNVKSISENGASDMANMVKNEANGEAIKYVLIVITMIPVMIIYPFVQKYFIKGIMIGSIKG